MYAHRRRHGYERQKADVLIRTNDAMITDENYRRFDRDFQKTAQSMHHDLQSTVYAGGSIKLKLSGCLLRG